MIGRIGAIGLLLACASVLSGAGFAATPIFSTVPMMYITYGPDCSFTFTIDGGITVDSSTSPGTRIPPGPYQLQITTAPPNGNFAPTGCQTPVFQLSGPAVSYSVNVVPGGFGGQPTVTLQPGATYVASDASRPAQTQRVVTTNTTGTSSSLLPPPPPPDTSHVGAVQPGLVGSGISPYRGKLRATVEPARTTLDRGSASVAALEAGRYDFVVRDLSRKGGFFVQKRGGKPIAITGVAFTGTRTVRVALTPGTWSFYERSGAVRTFTVRA